MTARLGVIGWSALTMITLSVVVGLALGWRPVVLVSDSMAPGAPAGALLVARPVAPVDVEVGDVVTVPDDSARPVTHRVITVDELDGDRWARLQGDANELPDPGRVLLIDGTLRTVAVVPFVGRLLAGADAMLLAGLALIGLGIAALSLLGRPGRTDGTPSGPIVAVGASRLAASSVEPVALVPPDPRAVALAATLEGALEDGLDQDTVQAIARVRTGALVGRGDVEDAVEAAGLDDGARFVLVAFADADFEALEIVPAGSQRARAARAAVEAWWARIGDDLPAGVRGELSPMLGAEQHALAASTASVGGVTGGAPVD